MILFQKFQLIYLILFIIISLLIYSILKYRYKEILLNKKFDKFFNISKGDFNFLTLTDHISWLMLTISFLGIVINIIDKTNINNYLINILIIIIIHILTALTLTRAYGELAIKSSNLKNYQLIIVLIISSIVFSVIFYGIVR